MIAAMHKKRANRLHKVKKIYDFIAKIHFTAQHFSVAAQ
jgi:hypothetical protein